MAGVRRGRHRTAAMIVGVLALMIAAPAIAIPAGAVAPRLEMAAKHHRHKHRKAKSRKGGGSAAQLKALKGKAATSTSTTTLPPLPHFAADAARLRGLVVRKRHAAKKLLRRVRPRVRLAVKTPKHKAIHQAKHKVSPLPLPELFLVALAPFALMGAYLLGTDHLRRREPGRRRASLVITPARDG